MGHGIALDDNGIIFPTGVPVSSISIRACLDSKVLATMEDEKEALADDIAYMLEFLDFDSPVASFANAVFEDGRLIIEAVPVMYTLPCRPCQMEGERSGTYGVAALVGSQRDGSCHVGAHK